MYDAEIGRFNGVDPLRGKYPHNSTYAFSENRVVDGVELEGLEIGPGPFSAYSKEQLEKLAQSKASDSGSIKNDTAENKSFSSNWKHAAENARMWNIFEVQIWAYYQFVDQFIVLTTHQHYGGGSSTVDERVWSFVGVASLVLPAAKGAGYIDDASKVVLNSVDNLVKSPKSIIGKSADDVSRILGEGWTQGTYGSKGAGWKFTKGDQSVFYHPGGGVHEGSYYGVSSGKLGRIKFVGSDYVPIQGDKATIILLNN